MVGKVYLISLALIFLANQVESDAYDHRETYAYYDLPFCLPDNVTEKKLSLGEMLNGARLVTAPYILEFRVDKDVQVLCNKTLTKSDVSKFRNAIEKDYYVQLYYDDLPIWGFVGSYQREYTDEGRFNTKIKKKYLLNTHFKFEVFYNKDRVIEVIFLTSHNSVTNTIDVTDDKEVVAEFTYSVKWSVTEQSFDKRMEKYISFSFSPNYMSVHRDSITNSSVILLILTVCLVTFYALVLRKDISKYSNDVEENQEETGWKNIHGDLFRFPQHKSLFAAALGSGTHLLVFIVAVLVLGLRGFFQPYTRVFWNALIIVYAITCVVSGYTSVSLYTQLEGSNWMKTLLLAGGLYFGPLCLTFSFLNSVAIFYGTTNALPLRAIIMLSLVWIFVALPLLLLGGNIGKNRKSDFHAPCRTNKCSREVLHLRWYRGLVPQMVLAGILPFSVVYIQLYYIYAAVWGHRVYTLYSVLFAVFILLLVITALVSVALTYFQLAAEDHEWWWRSFLCGGSTGLYMYGYCFYYYFWRSDMSGFMQTSHFFGYMACVCYGVFLVLGSVAFRSSLLFVRYLYAAIKCD
ncbi:transmembrane 9 superfamily member 3-like isoform X2 [Rutidosis leptorrhynchoides]|uniref:transmembrane 9 superfamily member 3-like isoform X2 n=1 Tax=Rutidosis leptorrhynchoides TaxID=125765 RepID=UPI003A99E84A